MGCGSAGGFSTVSSAGNKVMLVKKAMIIPPPAIWPSSESPRYEVGMNEENPTAVAAAASANGAPALRAALLRAGRSAPYSCRSAR